MELKKEQIDFIASDLRERGLTGKDIFSNIMKDHVCSAVENEMRSGKAFSAAHSQAVKAFAKNEIKNLRADILKAKDLFIFVDETRTPSNTFFTKTEQGVLLVAKRRNIYLLTALAGFILLTGVLSILVLKVNIPMFFVLLLTAIFSFIGLIYNLLGKSVVTIEENFIKIFENRFPLNYKKVISKKEVRKIFIEKSTVEMHLKGANSIAKFEFIKIQGKESVEFGRSLTPEQRFYLLNVLRAHSNK